MAASQNPLCTDEELLQELKTLGYENVSPDIFQMMKNDLAELVAEKKQSANILPKTSADKPPSPPVSEKPSILLPNKKSIGKLPKTLNLYSRRLRANLSDNPEAISPDSNKEIPVADISDSKYKTVNGYEVNKNSFKIIGQISALNSDSESSDFNKNTLPTTLNKGCRTIKRKVLRHRDGKPFITEQILAIPSIFDTSYPETESFENSKSFSSDDLSWKSNSSTGSLSPQTTNFLTPSQSTCSLLSSRSTISRLPTVHKKKNDPVAMYNYYKKYWDNFKPPGERRHDQLRWAVRDKMLEYNL
ncbi:hydrolethalus syndrome protein 1 homolog [Stegodyphus dumicola]|uniref:hydrolethalus syndrome protein 1 homolog n=1 Tax=Stegodyphus dumicola TaxID=202533 RepID=UPI0015A93832|nr:hydrolethalus syndrome protein 1 homolog [Stegodyphus dumicola]